MLDYVVMIENCLNGRRHQRIVIACDEADAVRRAYRALRTEDGDFYVLFARVK